MYEKTKKKKKCDNLDIYKMKAVYIERETFHFCVRMKMLMMLNIVKKIFLVISQQGHLQTGWLGLCNGCVVMWCVNVGYWVNGKKIKNKVNKKKKKIIKENKKERREK